MTIRPRFSRCCPLEIAHEEFPLHIVLCAGRNQKGWSISHSALNVNHLRLLLLLLWGLTDFRVSVFASQNRLTWAQIQITLSAGSKRSTLVRFSKGAAFILLIVVVMKVFLDLILGSEIASQGLFGDDRGHSQVSPWYWMHAFKSVHHYKVFSHHMPLFSCRNIFRVPYSWWLFQISTQSLLSIFADLCVLDSLKIQRCLISS